MTLPKRKTRSACRADMKKHKHPAKRAVVVPPTPICFGKEIAARLACAVDVCLAASIFESPSSR